MFEQGRDDLWLLPSQQKNPTKIAGWYSNYLIDAVTEILNHAIGNRAELKDRNMYFLPLLMIDTDFSNSRLKGIRK